MSRTLAMVVLTALVVSASSCGGGSSSTLGSSARSISISPTGAVVGSPDLTLTITGSNFAGATHNRSVAVWSVNGSDTSLATTFVSSTQLTAVIPAALLKNPVIIQVFVETGDPMGDVPSSKSNSVSFSVTAPSTGSVLISSISPTSAVAGSPDLTLTVTGSGFLKEHFRFSQAVWFINGNGTLLATTFVSNTQLTAVIPAALLNNPVTAEVWVGIWDQDTRIRKSNSVIFSVTSPISGISSSFVPAGSMSTARSGHAATLLMNGNVLVVGGDASAELFDPSSETFAPTGSMNTARFLATATLLPNGKVLIAGGIGPGSITLNSAELYDPLTGTFTETESMAVARVQHTATLLDNGKVLIAGGADGLRATNLALASAELFDPTTGRFTTIGRMISDRAEHTATLLPSGEVLIVGGWNGHRGDAADDRPFDPAFAELFVPSSDSFKSSGSMSRARSRHTATWLVDGRVLITGGFTDLGNPAPSELYDPAARAFSATGNMAISRKGHTATLLTNRKVLIAGGEHSGLAVNSAELFGPASASFTANGGLLTEREGHTATLLRSGRVLVAGGVDSNGNALATAELYE